MAMKISLMVLAATLMVACGAPNRYQGNSVVQVHTPNYVRERADLMDARGRVDSVDITECKTDECGGRTGLVEYGSGGMVRSTTRQEFTLLTAPHNPGALTCNEVELVYDDGTTERVPDPICRPADAPRVVQMPVSAPVVTQTPTAPRAHSKRSK